ncbi:type 1 fimbrial protein [Enterobacteriaceae bacterium RIT714]|nr:type 1 fimbrial protein [Enterobacteriaceae bacterium RIT714]
MKRYLVGMIIPFLLASGMAHATGTNIDIKGRLIANSCTIDTGTVEKEITLPSVQAHDLSEADTGGDWVNFTLDVTKCPAYLNTVTVKFSGTPDTDDSTTYKNLGNADNVALQLATNDVNYGNGSTMKVNVDQTNHSAKFPLSARIYSPKGGATRGTFNSVISVDFTWQ